MNYVNFTDKQLKVIISNLYERFEEEDVLDLIDDDDNCFESSVTDIIEDVVKYFGVEINSDTDISFFISLCRLNENTEGTIVRPQHNTYSVFHDESAEVSKTTTYKQNIGSFLDLTDDILGSMRNAGYYDYWEGEVVHIDESHYEVTRDDVSEIRKWKKK